MLGGGGALLAGVVARDRLRIDFGNDQRHVGVHAEMRRVVDDYAAGGTGARRMDGGNLGARRKQSDIDAAEIEGFEIADLEDLVLAE